MQKLKLNLQFTIVYMGILLFMGMAINPLTLIISYYIIAPWFVWIPMSQPDMRGSIDRSRSFPLEWNGRRIIPIASITKHDITWQQLCFFLAHPSAQIFREDLALAGESFDPLRQVWVKMPAMDERQVYCLLATTFIHRWDAMSGSISSGSYALRTTLTHRYDIINVYTYTYHIHTYTHAHTYIYDMYIIIYIYIYLL